MLLVTAALGLWLALSKQVEKRLFTSDSSRPDGLLRRSRKQQVGRSRRLARQQWSAGLLRLVLFFLLPS